MHKRELKSAIREQGYKKFRFGKVKRAHELCREIRICTPNEPGKVYIGYVPFGDSKNGNQEIYVCVKANRNWNFAIMQELIVE